LALHYHASEGGVKSLKSEVDSMGVQCRYYQADFTDKAAIESFIKRVSSDFDNLEILINSASLFEKKGFEDTSLEYLEDNLSVNFKAPFLLSQHFAKACQGKGHIINIIDTEITRDSATHFAYLLSKKALAELTRMSAKALGAAIRVNAICPGILMPCGKHDQNYIDKFKLTLPLQENANLEDVMHAINFLLSSRATTGQLLYVDGGEHLL
jgi:NAD(P)-dependent dehydrogenase (short-subunit alcohol dehydrogenase family)